MDQCTTPSVLSQALVDDLTIPEMQTFYLSTRSWSANSGSHFNWPSTKKQSSRGNGGQASTQIRREWLKWRDFIGILWRSFLRSSIGKVLLRVICQVGLFFLQDFYENWSVCLLNSFFLKEKQFLIENDLVAKQNKISFNHSSFDCY